MQLRTLALPLAGLLLGFGLSWAAAVPKKKAVTTAAPKKAAAKPAARNTIARRPVTKGRVTTSYSRGRTRGRSPQPVVARRYYGQQSPTQDRYLEIQQALVLRGFLQSTPSGTWDAATVDALKRFQEEQNLPPTGKITSLSLIALGLGPKRNPLSATVQPPAQPVP